MSTGRSLLRVVLGVTFSVGLTVLVGCAASNGRASPPPDGSSDAASGPIRDAGSSDMPSTTVDADAGNGPDVAVPASDAPAESRDGDASEADAHDDAGPFPSGDASGEDATDAPETAIDGAGDSGGAGGAGGADLEAGRLVGITAAHNAVRAAVKTQPSLAPLVWNPTIAAYAQQWATTLATTMCMQPQHRPSSELIAKGYGENLATFSVGGGPRAGMPVMASTAEQAVNAWAAEVACWTFGTILGSETCNTACYTNLHSDGCGHYTQLVWRNSTQLGCGVATCANGSLTEDIWICNYAPAGNVIGRAPY